MSKRSRSHSKSVVTKSVIKSTGGKESRIKDTSQLKAHLKYIGFRSSERSEKGHFDASNNKVDYKEFVKRVEKNKALKHSATIKAHKIVLSFKGLDYTAYKRSGKDMKDMVRNTIKEYEKRHNVKLDWIANTHEKDDHPHAHIVIKAVSDKASSDGTHKRVYFSIDDFRELRQIADKELDMNSIYHSHELDRTGSRTLDYEIMKDVTKGFEAVVKNIQRDIERDHELGERERLRAARNSSKESKER